jgi:peptidoglycan hydrolase CwlO-like protein
MPLARVLVAFALAAVLCIVFAPTSTADLQSKISAARSAASALRATVAADNAAIAATGGSLSAAQDHLNALEDRLRTQEAQLRQVQGKLLGARNHLVDLENRMHLATRYLAANLVARYENQSPNLMTVILQAHGFSALLEQLTFLKRVGDQDARIVAFTRAARVAVTHEVHVLASLEHRDRTLTLGILSQRTQVAAWKSALVSRQIHQLGARASASAKLHALDGRLHHLQSVAAAQAAAAARAAAAAQAGAAGPVATGSIAGLATDAGGMVQPPAGAPPAVGEVIAAANAIATMPYIYGGGHASFHADGYDCSGSVSYALAAAGLVSSPMTSGAFESWGEPGPGRWITVYANAGHVWMEVAGWRFDTVAQAGSGTRWAQGGGEFSGFVVRHPAGL